VEKQVVTNQITFSATVFVPLLHMHDAPKPFFSWGEIKIQIPALLLLLLVEDASITCYFTALTNISS
jgi:hypothetical protein